MRVAITGGAGFIGRHLGRRLAELGHELVLVDPALAEVGCGCGNPIRVEEPFALPGVFRGCEAVVHLAGVCVRCTSCNPESVHVDGTANVLSACREAIVGKVVYVSYLRARHGTGSPFYETKWIAEEFIRNSGLDYTILKSSPIYGAGDHWMFAISKLVHRMPLIPLIGLKPQYVRPVMVNDLVDLIVESLLGGLSRRTVSVVGPEVVTVREMIRRVAIVMNRHPLILPMPAIVGRSLTRLVEGLASSPYVTSADADVLSESMSRGLQSVDLLPEAIRPRTPFGWKQVRESIEPALVQARFP